MIIIKAEVVDLAYRVANNAANKDYADTQTATLRAELSV